MQVEIKPNATPAEMRLIEAAKRIAEMYRLLTPGSPAAPRMLGRYGRIVARLGYDPIS
ncbi:hypothetical protein AB0B88_16050 [Micromonospora haikouensis]|uniref:hypothetical protein n=1 Tax=Micromonospora haikouensis TaxID=686309 RepID=UPI0033F2A80E